MDDGLWRMDPYPDRAPGPVTRMIDLAAESLTVAGAPPAAGKRRGTR
jgi:hypothetical protein